MEKDFENKDRFSRRTIYTVPDGYFDTLEASIHAKTRKKDSPVATFLTSPSFRLATATACLIVAYMLWPSAEIKNAETLLSEVSEEQLLRYIEENTLPESDDILSYIDYTSEETTSFDQSELNDSIL